MTGATTRWLQILIVLLCALALRAVWLQRVAVEHFDEGVYASNVWFDASEGFAWPGRHFYAPPLVPALIEWSILLFGSGSLGTMLPGVLAGTATVALAFHVAGRWFGKEAAWPTAILATLSEFHIIYSRAALTDAVFCFFCLLAVYLGTEAARFAHWRRAIAAGVACGLAWWSKYTGWLPLAIVSTSVAVWFVMHGRAAMRFRSVVCVVLMGLVALLVFSPVLWQLQSVGGYAAVTANHRNYVGGLSLWTGSAQQLFGAHRVLDGWLGYSSAALAALAAIVWQLRLKSFTWNQSDAEFRIAPALVLKLTSGAILLTLLAASGVGSSAVLFCCAMGGVAGRLRWPAVPAESVEGSDQKTIACWALPCWTVAIWLLSLSLVTPMYRPYPRLTLPWLMAVWLGAGAGISWWVRANLRWHGRVGTHRPVLQHNVVMLLLLAMSAFVVAREGRLNSGNVAAFRPRTSMARLAERIRADCIASSADTVVYTFGEPAVFFHLSRLGILSRPVSDLPRQPTVAGGRTLTTLLIEGPHARATDSFFNDWTAVMHRYEKVASYEITPSDLVLLNSHDAASLARQAVRPTEAFHVWRVKDEQEQP